MESRSKLVTKLALPISVSLTVALTAIGFGTGASQLRPLVLFAVGLTISLMVAEYRNRTSTVLLTPAGVAVATLHKTGRLARGWSEDIEIEEIGEGTMIVFPHGDEKPADRYFADHHGELFELPPGVATAAEFFQVYPTSHQRAGFTIRREGSP